MVTGGRTWVQAEADGRQDGENYTQCLYHAYPPAFAASSAQPSLLIILTSQSSSYQFPR